MLELQAAKRGFSKLRKTWSTLISIIIAPRCAAARSRAEAPQAGLQIENILFNKGVYQDVKE